MDKIIRIGIIGTAGRGENPLSKAHWAQMNSFCLNYILEQNYKNVDLCSGGAAWADHTAVNLFFKKTEFKKKITLFLPCNWDINKQKFIDNGSSKFWENPGKTANFYHEKFSMQISGSKNSSLHMLDYIIKNQDENKRIIIGNGFHARNEMLANSIDELLAFTTSETEEPLDGGTLHTWKQFTGKKKHITLRIK